MKDKFRSFLTVTIIFVCLLALTACGSSAPKSYKFSQVTDTFTSTIDCAEDGSVVCEIYAGETIIGKWTGTWIKNEQGTLTVSFKTGESQDVYDGSVEHILGTSLPDDGLTVSSVFNGDGKQSIFMTINIIEDGNSVMPRECRLKQTD